MQDIQNIPTPDVDSFDPDIDPGGNKAFRDDPRDGHSDIEHDPDADPVHLPPDVEKRQPIEDPPHGDNAPTGDVDDSPTRISGE